MTKKDQNQEELSEQPDTSADEAAVEDFLAAEELNGEDILEDEASLQDSLHGVLSQQLEDALIESAKNLDGWQRAQAEFSNYRKRVERDQIRMREDAAARVINQILPVIDDLTRALKDRPQKGEAAEWAAGIDLINRKLLSVLENEGVKPMQVEGEMFDPNLHEAIAQVESPDHESGQIVEVLQEGYMIGERVLRAALVRVAI